MAKKYAESVDASFYSKGDKIFENVTAPTFKDKSITPHVIVTVGGEAHKVTEGQWLVKYKNGTAKVFNDKDFKESFIELPEEKKK